MQWDEQIRVAEENERNDAHAEHFKRTSRDNAAFRAMSTDEQFRCLANALRRPVAEWPEILEHEVRGAEEITVSPLVWQADLFRSHIAGRATKRTQQYLDINTAADWLIWRYDLALGEQDAIRNVLAAYFGVLVRAGYLRRRPVNEFEIVRDFLEARQGVRAPKLKPQPKEFDIRELSWGREVVNGREVLLALEVTGVHVPPGTKHSFVTKLTDPYLRWSETPALFARRIAWDLQITIEATAEFLTVAGVFRTIKTPLWSTLRCQSTVTV